ncbi:MAG: hypothetical protein AAGA77_21280 [Bacteroidota bacterium]
MRLTPSEEYIKSMFEDHDQAIETEALWNDIKKRKKPRRRIFWIFFVGLMYAIVTTVVLFDIFGKDQLKVDQFSEVDTSVEETDQNLDPYAGAPSSNVEINRPHRSKTNTQIANDAELDVNYPRKNEKSIHPNDNDLSKAGNRPFNGGVQSGNFGVQRGENIQSRSAHSDHQSHVMEEVSSQGIEQKLLQVDLPVMRSKTFGFETLGLLSLDPLVFNRSFKPLTIEYLNPEIDNQVPNRALIFEYRTGVGLGNKNLKHIDGQNEAYKVARENAEELVSVWQNGFLVGWRKNHLLWKVGINYRLRLEKFQYRGANSLSTLMQDTLSILVNDNNEVLSAKLGSVETITETHYDFVRENQIHSIGVPFEIGWAFKKNQFEFSTLLATESSIVIKRKGSYLNDINSFVSFDQDSPSTDYSSKVLFQGGVRTNLSYLIRKHLSIGIGLYMMRYMNSLTRRGSRLTEKPIHYGLDLSVRYHLLK